MHCEDFTFSNYIIKSYKFGYKTENYHFLVKIFRGEIIGYKKLIESGSSIDFNKEFIELEVVNQPISLERYSIIYAEEKFEEEDDFPYLKKVGITNHQNLLFIIYNPVDLTIEEKSIFMNSLKNFVFMDKIYQEWSDVICRELLLEIRDYNIDGLIYNE